MSGTCLFKIEHSCGSSDGLQVYECEDGDITGYCFSCGDYVEDPLGTKSDAEIKKLRKGVQKKAKEEVLEEMDFISALAAHDLSDRKLRKKSLEHYNIGIGLSEYDGKTPAFAYFPYTKGGEVVKYKVKMLDSGKVWSVGTDNEVDLFGWEQAKETGAKRLIITEGEFDCPSLYKILALHTPSQYREMTPAVVSIPNGAASASKDISRLLPEIRRHFKDISLCFDQDRAGLDAVDAVCKLAPDFKVIALPAKDANECLIKGVAKAAHKATTFNADKNKNSKLVWGEDIHDAAKEQAKSGLSWPWPGMTKLTRGIRYGEVICFAAGEKLGKSTVVDQIAAHLIKAHGIKVMLAKPEEGNNKTYQMVNAKVAGKIFHDPDIPIDQKAYAAGGEVLKGKLCMLNLYQNLDWDSFKADVYTAAGAGVKAVFLDPVTNLTNGMSSSDINTALQGIVQDLAAMAKDLDIVIFIMSHLNKPAKGNKPWDRGASITTDYFAGSSALARSCNYAIGLEGDKDPELSREERNFRELVILADREFGESGKVRLYYDYKSGLLNEVIDHV